MDKDPAVTLTGRATADPARDGPLTLDLVTVREPATSGHGTRSSNDMPR